ncbi:NAD(H) kinase 3 isoform 2 [Theobroma cacao]|uniref:NAD(H) kinase 3 isoform 2 n=1 Tax=Theobroma cacao TaxID=3641 RepID=A0A061F9E1_THECC|nr:NAD(H) kinase 3 isoform 2 [Theobroma cacao]
MAIRKLLLLLKPFDVYHATQSNPASLFTNPRVVHYLNNRSKVHKEAIDLCQKILQQKSVDWQPIFRNDLSQPIRNVDLVVTVGGDGTLLQASHFMDDTVPVIGVNSDPTQAEEVEEFSNEFDANRSTGYLCAATVKNFEQVVLDSFLEGQTVPSKLSRISVSVNSKALPAYALNDILIAHPCPATLSRFSFKSSGLRVSTAAGSTAAMLSAGGFAMPILSQDLQYMVREPIASGGAISGLMHGLIKSDQSIDAAWFSKEGSIYVDGSYVFFTIQSGDTIEISSKAPVLQVVLAPHLSS